MEIFVFVRMGGEHDDIIVKLLHESGGLAESLTKFDAAKARCFLDVDRQRLLAVVEASFGTFAPFNKLVHGLLKEATRRESSRNSQGG